MKLEELNPTEEKRTYHFPGGEAVTLEKVTHFAASNTTHRLKTADGKLHIMPRDGWLHVEIDAADFSV